MAEHPYAKVIPLWRDLDRTSGVRETEDERLMKLRYPPTGDPEAWVRFGPDPQSRPRNWAGRNIRDHQHTAGEPGADCRVCGFPWWPQAGV